MDILIWNEQIFARNWLLHLMISFVVFFCQQIQLYGGLALFCAFILYDTQLIIEKKRNGDNDFLWYVLQFSGDIALEKRVYCLSE